MQAYPLYKDVTASFLFPTSPDETDAAVTVRHEWGDVVLETSAPIENKLAAITVAGDLVVAAGTYNIKWSVSIAGKRKHFDSSFVVENQYVSEETFMNVYEDMNTSEYSGEIFNQAETVARRIIDTFCGQNFQFVGEKTISRDGNGSDRLFMGQRLNHIDSAMTKYDSRTEDITAKVRLDYKSRSTVQVDHNIPKSATIAITGDWGWVSPPPNIQEAATLLIRDLLEDTRREHHSYGISRIEQDNNRIWFNEKALNESTGNLDVDVLLIDYINWVPDWI